MNAPVTPSRSATTNEPLSPNGDNLAFLCPELSTLMDDLRDKVKAARAWPVAGFPMAYTPTFTPFQRLPSEIRQRIYQLASYQPRILEVTCPDGLICDTPAPAVLHTSSESRKIALRVYEPLVFGDVQTGTYVNWNHDTIFVNDHRSVRSDALQYSALHEKCKNLALPGAFLAPFNFPTVYKSVECLVIVLNFIPGEGNMVLVPVERDQEKMARPKQELLRLWQVGRIKSYMIRDAIRGPERTVGPKEKLRARQRREKERKSVEPLRNDEDLAIRLQYDLDHGHS